MDNPGQGYQSKYPNLRRYALVLRTVGYVLTGLNVLLVIGVGITMTMAHAGFMVLVAVVVLGTITYLGYVFFSVLPEAITAFADLCENSWVGRV